MRNRAAVLAASVLLTGAALAVPATAGAAASPHANPVAASANTNGPYMASCKQESTAMLCATGPNNNGAFTSSLAHAVNGP